MAHKIWERLPQYSELKRPIFSDSWLEGFKSRCQIRRYTRHGKAAAVDQEILKKDLEQI